MYLVPQILTNNSEAFIRTAKGMQEYGYEEINLNLGCPSKTVVNGGRGSGFLADREGLQRFLDEIFESLGGKIKISIKTRLGRYEPEEIGLLMEIFNQYPLEELIIHPRVQKDYYKNTPRLETFGEALEHSKTPVCYNGDIVTAKDYLSLKERFPALECIMTGRGTLRNPALAREIRGGAPASKEEIRRFHDMMYNEYCEDLSGDRNILFRMKDYGLIWHLCLQTIKNMPKRLRRLRNVWYMKMQSENYLAVNS